MSTITYRKFVVPFCMIAFFAIGASADSINQPTSFKPATANSPATATYENKEQTAAPVVQAATPIEGAIEPLFVKNASGEEVEIDLMTRKLLLAGRCCGADPNLFLRSVITILDTRKDLYDGQKLDIIKHFSLLITGLGVMNLNNDTYALAFKSNSKDLTDTETAIAANAAKLWLQQRSAALDQEINAINENIKILNATTTLPRPEGAGESNAGNSKPEPSSNQ